MRFNQKQVDIAFFGLGLLLAVSYLFLIQKPINLKIKGLETEKKYLSEKNISINDLKEKLSFVKGKKANLRQEIQKLETNFFQNDFIWDIMQNLDTMAADLGLKVLLIHPKVEEETENYRHNSFFLKLDGEFPASYRLLSLLEKNIPTLQIRSIKMEAKSDSDKNLSQEIVFDVFTPKNMPVSRALNISIKE